MTEARDSNFMYLPKDYWSARYESNFYTVKIESKRLVSSYDQESSVDADNVPKITQSTNNTVGGKRNLPAYYYEVVVYRQHGKTSVFRRYSQFKWLHDQILSHPLPSSITSPETERRDSRHIPLPSGTCLFQWQNDEFAQKRLELLSEYMDDLLSQPGYANHPAVIAFLELE